MNHTAWLIVVCATSACDRPGQPPPPAPSAAISAPSAHPSASASATASSTAAPPPAPDAAAPDVVILDDYTPVVVAGRQRALSSEARRQFATYIHAMHERIHKHFADQFIESLGSKPRGEMSNMKLFVQLELILDAQRGAVLVVGVVKSSGVRVFDDAAAHAIVAAGPFGAAPVPIVSHDGKVYVQWDLFRDPYYACTDKFARPYLLTEGDKAVP